MGRRRSLSGLAPDDAPDLLEVKISNGEQVPMAAIVANAGKYAIV